MKTSNQKGFSVVEGVLILVIVAVLGGVGWFVWHSKNNTNSTYNAAANSGTGKISSTKATAAKVTTTTTDTTSSKWLLYTPSGKQYSIRVPDGWKFTATKGSDENLYAFDMPDLTFKQGTKASVDVVEGGRDFSSVALLLGYSSTFKKSDYSTDLGQATKQTGFKTDAGVAVDQYYFLETKNPEVMGLPKDTKQYIFVVQSGGHGVVFYHDILKGEKDQLKYVVPMIKSLKFLK